MRPRHASPRSHLLQSRRYPRRRRSLHETLAPGLPMHRTVRRVAAAILVALGLVLGTPQADSAPATESGAAAAPQASQEPVKVMVGAYINDIQQLDFKTNNYAVDLYVWFRWKSPELDPSKTMEFMNRYASDDNLREELYDKPEVMPDASLYAI